MIEIRLQNDFKQCPRWIQTECRTEAEPGKQLPRNTAEQDAQELLEEIGIEGSPKGWKEEIKRIYAACNDPRVQFQIITGLQLRAWGKTDSKSKPAEPLSGNDLSSAERLEQILTEAARRASKSSGPG